MPEPEHYTTAREILASVLGWGFSRASGMPSYGPKYEELTEAIARAISDAPRHN